MDDPLAVLMERESSSVKKDASKKSSECKRLGKGKMVSKSYFGSQFFIKEIEPYNFFDRTKFDEPTGWPSFRSVHSSFAKVPQKISEPPKSVAESEARKLARFLKVTLETGWDRMDLPENPRAPITNQTIQYVPNVPDETMDMYGRPFFVTNADVLRAPNICNAKTEYDLNVHHFLASRLQMIGSLDPDEQHKALSFLLDDAIYTERQHSGCGLTYMINPTTIPRDLADLNLGTHPVNSSKLAKENLLAMLYPSPNQWLEVNSDKKEVKRILEACSKDVKVYPDSENTRLEHLANLTKTWMFKNGSLVFFKKHVVKKKERGHDKLWYRYQVKYEGKKLPRKITPRPLTVENFQECLHWVVQYYRLLNLIGTVRAIPDDQPIPANHRQHDSETKPQMFATMPVVLSNPRMEPLIKKYSLAALEKMASSAAAVDEANVPKIVLGKTMKSPYLNWQTRYMRDYFFNKKGNPKRCPNPYTTWDVNSSSGDTAVVESKIEQAQIQDRVLPGDRMAEAYHIDFMLRDVAETHEALIRTLEEKMEIDDEEDDDETQEEGGEAAEENNNEESEAEEEEEEDADITLGQRMFPEEEEEQTAAGVMTSPEIQGMKSLAAAYKARVEQTFQVFQGMNKRGLFLLMSITQKERQAFIDEAEKMRKAAPAIFLNMIPERWLKTQAPIAIIYDAARLAWYGEWVTSMEYSSKYCPTSFVAPDKSSSSIVRIVLNEEGKLTIPGIDQEEECSPSLLQFIPFPVEITREYANKLIAALLLLDKLSESFEKDVQTSTRRRNSLREVEKRSPAAKAPAIADLPVTLLEFNNWAPHTNAYHFLFTTVSELMTIPFPRDQQVQEQQQQPSLGGATVDRGSQQASFLHQQTMAAGSSVKDAAMDRGSQQASCSHQQTMAAGTSFEDAAMDHGSQQASFLHQQTMAAGTSFEDEHSVDFTHIYKNFADVYKTEVELAQKGWGSNLKENNKQFFRQVVLPAVQKNEHLESSAREKDPVLLRSCFLEGMLHLQRNWEKNPSRSSWVLAPCFIQSAMKNRIEQSRLTSRAMKGFLSGPSTETAPAVVYPSNDSVESSEPLFKETPIVELPPVDVIVINTARFLEDQKMFTSIKHMLRTFWKPALKQNRQMYQYMKEHNLYLADWYMIDDVHGFFMDALDYSALTPTSTVKVFNLFLMVKNFSNVLNYYRESIQSKVEEVCKKWEDDDNDQNSSDSHSENCAFEIEEFATQMFM